MLLLLWLRRHVIHGVLDGLVYAGLVGIGFAFTENILYFAGAYAGEMGLGPGGFGAATTIFVVRGVFSPFAHPLFTSAIGIGAGIMVGSRRRWLRWLAPLIGYVVAVGLHAAWNGSAFLADGRFFPLTYFFAMVPGFFALVGLAIWFRVREGRMLTRSLTDLAHRGYLDLAEVPWLVRPPARRTARRNARRRGGPEAERTLREYQRQAIELAVLHDHVMRGHRGRRGREAARHPRARRPHGPPARRAARPRDGAGRTRRGPGSRRTPGSRSTRGQHAARVGTSRTGGASTERSTSRPAPGPAPGAAAGAAAGPRPGGRR